MKKLLWVYILISICSINNSSGQNKITSGKNANNITGYWAGSFKDARFTIPFSIDITKNKSTYTAYYNSDAQRALNIPLQNIIQHKDSIQLELRGDNDILVFKGKIDQNLFSGQIRKGSQTVKFSLVKKIPIPKNYKTTEVTFKNDTVVLSGTLFLPKTNHQTPALLFLHGSGSEQRFTSAYMADYFASKGIAVLIYDKRGTGKSTGNWAISSFKDLANDAISGIKLLQNNPQISSNHIGIYGHSQGGSICPMVLTMYPEIAFGISAASAGVSMAESDWYELQNRFKNYVSGNDYDNAMIVLKQYLHFALTHQGYNELMTVARKYEKQKWYQDYIGTIDTTSSFFRTYPKIGNYNPIDYWKSVRQNVLILKGDHDLTCPGYPTFQNIENALNQANNNKYKIVLFPNTTHEMHVVVTPNDFSFTGSPGYCETILNWINTTKNGN